MASFLVTGAAGFIGFHLSKNYFLMVTQSMGWTLLRIIMMCNSN